jgi:hypothetical protein
MGKIPFAVKWLTELSADVWENIEANRAIRGLREQIPAIM